MRDHPPAIFIADSRGLDSLNSVATPVDTEIDWIADGDGFLDWLAQANYIATDVLDDLRARAMPGELDRVAGETRQLREWCRGVRVMARHSDASSSVSVDQSSLRRFVTVSPTNAAGRLAAFLTMFDHKALREMLASPKHAGRLLEVARGMTAT